MPTENQSPEVGIALRWLRTQSGLQQRELSERMALSGRGVSTVWLSQVENGRRQPSPALVARMLQALDSDHSQLDAVLATRPWVGAVSVPRTSTSNTEHISKLIEELGELNALYASLDPAARKEVLSFVRRKGLG